MVSKRKFDEFYNLGFVLSVCRIHGTVELTTMEILLMCSLLCASDVIAAVSLLTPKKQPKLFSLVFGEGIVNDAVCIILFNTVNEFAKDPEAKLDGAAVGLITLDFLILGVVSTLLGLVFGLMQSYLMKKVRSFTRDPVAECSIIFSAAYISYVVAEMCHQSGIITLLTCGITMAHYGWYNLSPQGQTTSNVVFQFLGFIAEGFIFCYLGLTFFSYRYLPFSPWLIIILMCICTFGRLISTVGLVAMLKLCGYEKSHPHPLNYKELVFIWYAGLIRGAIAFGLVLRIEKSFAGRDLIVTTCLSLVLITTIIYGSTVGVINSCLFPESRHKKKEEDEEIDDEIEEAEDVDDESSDASSERSELKHPNRLPQPLSSLGSVTADDNYLSANALNSAPRESGTRETTSSQARRSRREKKKRKSCGAYIARFDEFCMKPIFIRKYTPEAERLAENFAYEFMEKGEKNEKEYIAAGKG